jgi:shikimate kinase
MRGKHLILIGLMGAGKTTVGRRCAELLEREFVDTDDLVVLRAGMPIDEIFGTVGETHFRAVEREVVADVCASPAPLVLACGGGTVLDPENRRLLRTAGVVVWLRAPVPVLSARIGDGSNRPLLVDDPRGVLARLDRLREPVYEAAADRAIDTEALDIEGVSDAVVAAYESARA